MPCGCCGYENRDDATFCGGCGAVLHAERLSETPASRTPTPRPSPALPASFAGGRYEVKRVIGEGGRKRVYLAHDTKLDSDVAIAVVKTEGLDSDSLTRIRREAQAMGRLRDHPHIVTVHDIGDEDGQPYIVSQFMAGGDLEGLLREAESHRLPIDHAVRIANEVRQALEYAHGRGIIHRDLKPGNIWLTADGTAKLGDFGLAMAVDRSRVTQAGMMLGTVAYMPPEQALGRTADARSDLYALGCVLYEMVTGRPPFLGDDSVAIISQHINTAPVAPTWHNPQVPRALEALIMRLLAKDPADRPESAAALAEVLRAAMETATTVAGRAVGGEANPLDRLAGGVFVGREKEMDELRAGLEDALSGRGRLLMLVGEPGIGKTRTSEEFATYAGLRNAQVLWGRCYEGEGAPAYWPWVQVVRSYVHDRDSKELMSEMGPGAADIAQVVSEVKERLPGLPAPPALEPEQARFRLFDSITTFLKNASKGQPIVLVLDDLHWADKPSLLMLQFLARELQGARLLVLGTYRDVELRRQHPLAETLGDLARQQLSQRVLLRGLSEQDVARFIELTAGKAAPEALVAAVYRETEGNPFFVNEIVRLLVSDGRLDRPGEVASWSVTIPQSVREVVGRRLDHLSEACNRVLTAAAVIGREFGVDALEQVSDVSGDRLLEVMEEAVAARVVNEVPRTVGRYSFSHALIRETLYEELGTTRRVRLHRQIGEVLEDLYAANQEPHLAELAHHFCEAAPGGDLEKAIDYATRAGERANALLAYEEAADHYAMALQALELQEKPDERQRCELLLALGEAQTKGGDAPNARETFQQAVDTARALGLAEQLARAALGFGGAFSVVEMGRVNELLVGLLEEALSGLGTGDSSLRARVLARLTSELYFSDALERRASLSQEAVAVARRVGDPATLVLALGVRHDILFSPWSLEERTAITTEVQRLAEESGDKQAALRGHAMRLLDLLVAGDIQGVDKEIEACAALANELRQPFYIWWAELVRAMRALLAGRFEEAEMLAKRALAVGQRAAEQNAVQWFGAQMVTAGRLQGRSQELAAVLKGFADQYPAVPAWRSGLALIYSDMRREEEARSEFERLAAHDFADIPQDDNWFPAMVMSADVCAFLGDARRAATLYKLLLPFAGRNVVVGASAVSFGSSSHYLGLLAATLSRWDEAARHFEDAIRMHTMMGARPWLAQTKHEYANMLLAREKPGDREKALELIGPALDTAQELGMKPLVEKALALKLQAQGIDISSPQTSIDAVLKSVHDERPDLRPHAAPDGTVTIMFSDIEGSTAMNERLGDQAWQELLRKHNGLIREQLRAHGGFEVKTMGDGFMMAFASADSALQCAIGIQRAFAERNERAEQPIRVRIGLHTGEAIKDGQDFFGKNVILAARIAAQARGGEILVSSLLKELTASAGEFTFGEACKVELKGLRGKHSVFEVAWE